VFTFPEGEMMLTMPVPGVGEDMRPGHRRCYFIWYRAADERTALPQLFTDSAGRHHGMAIPPPSIRPELIRELKELAPKIFAPEVAAPVVLAAQPLLQAITDLEVPQLTFGRVALLGDSAFVARPHVAAGISKAALDAKCLADEIAAAGNDVIQALTQYNQKQHHFGSSLVAHARYLGAYLEGQAKPLAERILQERERDPEQIIRDYGAAHLLRNLDVAAFLGGRGGEPNGVA
jgi:2-polyprenyl-6-methoxyphenol hydroxylase-like FAD-dependent oxidoreductase